MDVARPLSSQLADRSPVADIMSSVNSIVTPEMIRPFMKAQPRKSSRQSSRKGRTLILTDTPVKAQLEATQRERNSRKTKGSGTDKTTKRKVHYSPSNAIDCEHGEIAEKVSKTSEKTKKTVRKKVSTTTRKKTVLKHNRGQTITDDDDTPCAMCGKRCNEPPLEDWKQCPSCKQWCHDRCCPDDVDTCYRCLC